MSSLERQLDVAVQQHNAVVKQNKDLQKECNTYKEALKKVKEIAEEWLRDYCWDSSFEDKEGCCICHENTDCYSYRLLVILKEVESE